MTSPVRDLLVAEIEASGPISYERLTEVALYDPGCGFYAVAGKAGRRGDFVTSPEVGPLFGAVFANALDTWWSELGEPAEFTVVECGAGPGTMARAVARAQPACASSMRYVMVEISAAQREMHPEFAGYESAAQAPQEVACGVVFANELLDNVPFGIAEHDGTAWREVLIDFDGRALVEVVGDVVSLSGHGGSVGARAPLQHRAAAWVTMSLATLRRGRVVAVDYALHAGELEGRAGEWLRTYRGQERGLGPLDDLGLQDITSDVVIEQLPVADVVTDQAGFLRRHGIEALVEEGRAIWRDAAAAPTLDAIAARSRVGEAEALLDPAGLGGFTVLEWSAK